MLIAEFKVEGIFESLQSIVLLSRDSYGGSLVFCGVRLDLVF